MSRLSSPWWFHPSSTRISSLYNLNLAIWDMGNGHGRPYQPTSSKGYRFILTITDYLSKWAEAIPLKEVKASDVIKFVKHHVIYCFGVPRRIIHDNGSQFVSQAFQEILQQVQNSESLQRHTIQSLTTLQKLSTRLLESFSRNSSRKANVTRTTS